MIFNIITSKNFEELVESLTAFINSKDDSRSKNKMLHDLRQQLEANAFLYRGDAPFEILCGAASIRAFLLRKWTCKETYSENRKEIFSFLKEIQQGIMNQHNEAILNIYDRSVTFTQYLNNRLSFFDTLSCRQSLKLYLVELLKEPVPEIVYLDDDTTKQDVFIYYPADMDFVKYEYNFAIQMGHFLRYRLTHSTAVPQSFTWLREAMVSSGDDWGTKECTELFAICFAIAALHNSEYSDQDPNFFIHDEDKRILSSYMAALVKSQGDITKQEFTSLLQDKPLVDLSGKHLS